MLTIAANDVTVALMKLLPLSCVADVVDEHALCKQPASVTLSRDKLTEQA